MLKRLTGPVDVLPHLSFVDRTVNLDMTVIEVLAGDNRRVGILWSNRGGSDAVVRPVRDPTGTFGILLPSVDPPVGMKFSDWGPILGQPWRGIASGVATDLYVIEILWIHNSLDFTDASRQIETALQQAGLRRPQSS